MEENTNENIEELSDKKYKMSVVMPVYNTDIKLLNGSVDSLLTQTLKDVEIVIVNDCSTNKNIKPALAELSQKDSRIKIINLENNVGSFAARLIAMKETKGDYVGFLDSDDKLSPNCLREMYNKAVETNAEIVATSFCKDDPVLKIYFNTLDPYRIKNYDLYGEDIIKEYFLQHGEFYAWQIMCNKIYSQKLIRDIIPHLDDFVQNYPRLIMGDDVAFNFVAYTYANHFVSISGEGIYYLTHEGQSTNQVASKSKYLRNVNDISNVFLFMKNFLTKFELYDKYIEDISIWKNNFANYYYCCGKECLKEDEALNLIREKMELPNYVYKVDESVNSGYFYDSLTENTGNEHGKNAIIYGISNPKTKYVMFDVFSVLTTSELFDNKDIIDIVSKSEYAKNIDFYSMRINAEKALEKEKFLTLDKIYLHIQEKYNLSAEVCLSLKKEETKLLIKHSKIRDFGLKLYELAKDFDKKIIVTSRGCFDEETIKNILNKNGYETDKIYLPNYLNLSKENGDFYKHILKDLNIKNDELAFIGGDYKLDVEVCRKIGIRAYFVPDMIQVFKETICSQLFNSCLKDVEKILQKEQYIDFRNMMALVRNKVMDNPFSGYPGDSLFGGQPNNLGYFAVGMKMISINDFVLKIMKDAKTIYFAQEFGYLPMKAFEVLAKYNKELPKINYLPVSNQALMLLKTKTQEELFEIKNKVSIYKLSVKKIAESFYGDSVNLEKLKEKCENNNISFNKNFANLNDFNFAISLFDREVVNYEKHSKYCSDILSKLKTFVGKKDKIVSFGSSSKLNKSSNNIEDFIDDYFDCNEVSARSTIEENIFSDSKKVLRKYKITDGKLDFDFKVKKIMYPGNMVVDIIQNQAINFVDDYYKTYGFGNSYLATDVVNLPYETFINAPRIKDKYMLDCFVFSDGIRKVNIKKVWLGVNINDYYKNSSNLVVNGAAIKITKLLNKLLPPNSKRRKFAKKVYKLFKRG